MRSTEDFSTIYVIARSKTYEC